jgi:hypothetical protein
MRKLQLLGALFFATLTLGVIAPSAFAGWLVDGTEAIKAEATETEEELTLTDLGAPGTPEIFCKDILDGTIGPGEKDQTTEVLNVAKEKIGTNKTGLALSCEDKKGICANPAEVWPDNLPWSTELAGMESSPFALDQLLAITGKVPGYTLDCKSILGLVEDICEGATSAEVENSFEKRVLERFDPETPIESQKMSCTLGGAGAGDIKGEGSILLTSGKTLSEATVGLVNFGIVLLAALSETRIITFVSRFEEADYEKTLFSVTGGMGVFSISKDQCNEKKFAADAPCNIEVTLTPLNDLEPSTARINMPYVKLPNNISDEWQTEVLGEGE